MVSRFRLLAASLVIALIGVGLSMTTAQAAVARVSGVIGVGEDNYNAKLKARWTAVSGATYQVRWAGSTTALAKARPIAVSGISATSPVLNRCVINYVQVRAVRGGAVGPWSAAKGLRFHNEYPGRATITGAGLEDGVQFNWKYASNATRYKVSWNAGPFGKFEGGLKVVGPGWTNQYARSLSLSLPTTPVAGDQMMGVAYANPVYAQIQSSHICRAGIPKSTFVPVFPKAPTPGPGDDLRMGTYNTELFPNNTTSGGRINGIVKNIVDHDLTVVALQEANEATATSVESKLPARWRVAPPQRLSGQQILYDGDVFRAVSSGVFDVPNPKVGVNDLPTPWIRLAQVNPSSADSQDVLVVSIHFAEDPAKSQMAKKHDANLAAQSALRSIDAANPHDLPVIVAGDFRYLREPFVDRPGYVEGPPTFVRNGYFDAMAAVKKSGYQYTTVNGHTPQVPALAGVASRADYIMLKGFEGSRSYVNVANWRYNSTWVSDHNLVYADLTIPYR